MADRPHVDPYVIEEIARLTDGDSWQLADFLVEQFPTDEYGDADNKGTKTGLYAAFDDAEEGLRREYGIEVKANRLRGVRATALAWPGDRRRSPAPFEVHFLIRGEDRETRMDRYLKRNKGRPLTVKAVQRFRADDKPTAPVPWDELAERRITSVVRALLAVTAKQGDWWETADPQGRAQVAAILRDLATKVQP